MASVEPQVLLCINSASHPITDSNADLHEDLSDTDFKTNMACW